MKRKMFVFLASIIVGITFIYAQSTPAYTKCVTKLDDDGLKDGCTAATDGKACEKDKTCKRSITGSSAGKCNCVTYI